MFGVGGRGGIKEELVLVAARVGTLNGRKAHFFMERIIMPIDKVMPSSPTGTMLTSGEGGGEGEKSLGRSTRRGGARSMQIYVQIQWLTNANSRYYTDDLWNSTNPASAQPSAIYLGFAYTKKYDSICFGMWL